MIKLNLDYQVHTLEDIFNENSRRNLVNLFIRGMRIFLFLTSR